jgi:hypothetical protein
MDPGPEPRAAGGIPWRVSDALWVWLAGLVVAVVSASVVAAATGSEAGDPGWEVLLAASAGQFATFAAGTVVAARARGSEAPARDLGLRVHPRDAWAIALGVGLLVAAGLALAPLRGLVDDDQDVVEELLDASGGELAVLAVTAGVVAPVVEELLFRGLLLRALLRRFSANGAIGVSAAAFALVHAVGDPSPGTLVVLPAFVVLGAVSAHHAVRTGDLSRSVLLHFGFNLPTVAAALAGG